jgi:hypothetical protein
VVERQRRERAPELGVAGHDRDLVGIERRAHQFGEQRARGRRELRHLHERAVARRQGGDERTDCEIDRVVPRHDDPDHAERLGHHLRAAGQEPQRGGAPLGLHPLAQVAARVAHRLQAGEQLEQPRLVD